MPVAAATALPFPLIPFLYCRSLGCDSAPQRVPRCRRRLPLLLQLHCTQLQLRHELRDPLTFHTDELVQYTGRAASSHDTRCCPTTGPVKKTKATEGDGLT